MRRFIDLFNQTGNAKTEFAFYDTTTDKFETFSDSQTWESTEEFINDYEGNQLARYLKLIQKEFSKQKK